MLRHQRPENYRPGRAGRHEQAKLPGDDLRHQAQGFQAFHHAVGEAGEFEAMVVHYPDAAKLEAVLKLQTRSAVHDG